jgi:hypothetical protein
MKFGLSHSTFIKGKTYYDLAENTKLKFLIFIVSIFVKEKKIVLTPTALIFFRNEHSLAITTKLFRLKILFGMQKVAFKCIRFSNLEFRNLSELTPYKTIESVLNYFTLNNSH